LAGGFVENPFFQFAGTLLFDKKNPPKCCTILVWIAGCLNSSSFLSRSSPPKEGREKKKEVGGLEVFLSSGSEL
jgi:hypothetical protein